MNHWICLYWSVSRLLLAPKLYASIFLIQGKGDPLRSHQAAAWPSPWLTEPSVFHPRQTVKQHWCIDLRLCHCYGRYQESRQSEPELSSFHIKFSFCSTAAAAWCRKSAPAGKQRAVRPAGQRNLPSTLHLLFYASSPPCWAPRALLPKPRTAPRAGGSPQPQYHAPKPLSRAKQCHQRATGLEEHVP